MYKKSMTAAAYFMDGALTWETGGISIHWKERTRLSVYAPLNITEQNK